MVKRPEKLGRDSSLVALTSIAIFSLYTYFSAGESHAPEHQPRSAEVHGKKIGSAILPHSISNQDGHLLQIERQLEAEQDEVVHLTPAQIAEKIVTPVEFAAWSKVNNCEERGNWHVSGSKFSGGLGISNYNWGHFGGFYFSVSGATASPDEQIVIARRIQSNPPDQNGVCVGW